MATKEMAQEVFLRKFFVTAWMIGMAAWLGCHASPAKSCTKDGDCDPSTGGYCDTEHSVCRVGPGGDGGFAVNVWVDAGTRGTFLRSDMAQILVSATAANTTFKWSIRGVADGGSTEAQPSNVTPVSTPCPAEVHAASCAVIPVDLSAPALNAISGEFGLVVSGTSSGSTSAEVTAPVPVTRVKWQQRFGTSMVASPAISDADGTLYVATADVGGALIAVNLDGTTRWSADAGQVIASPAVGASDVYVAGEERTTSQSFFLDLTPDGSVQHRCPEVTGFSEALLASPSITSASGAESALAFTNDASRLIPLTPSDQVAVCGSPVTASGAATAGGSVVSVAKQAFLGAGGPNLLGFVYLSNWNAINTWFNPYVGVGSGDLAGIGLAGELVVGSVENHGAWGVYKTDGGFAGASPNASVGTSPGSVAITSTGRTIFGSHVSTLRSVTVPNGPASQVSAAGPIFAAPLIGKDSTLYTASQTGNLQVWDTDLTPQWSAALTSTDGGFFASPNIDCARYSDGGIYSGPGTLYLAAVDGNVWAIQVDSHGLDPSAPWPRYQHDSRSTGNADAGIMNCP